MQQSLEPERHNRSDGARETTIKVLRFLRLNRVAARVYYRYFHGFESADKTLPTIISRCFRKAVESGIADRGDYFEFGVFKGYTFWQAQLAAREFGLEQIRFFGFDSFAGLPKVHGVDDVEDGPFYEGQFACSLDQVKKELDKRGTDWGRSSLIKGYFEETLSDDTRSKFGMRKASIVLIDCDLYESTAVALDFLRDMFLDGTILIMDDWNAYDRDDSKGERLALAEFSRTNPDWVAVPWFPYGLYGQVFTMQRSAPLRD